MKAKIYICISRTVLPNTICSTMEASCSPLSQLQVADLFEEVANEFEVAHAGDTCGVQMIFAPERSVNATVVQQYLELMMQLLNQNSGFFVGFDLVGQEDLGRPLIDFAGIL